MGDLFGGVSDGRNEQDINGLIFKAIFMPN